MSEKEGLSAEGRFQHVGIARFPYSVCLAEDSRATADGSQDLTVLQEYSRMGEGLTKTAP